ncbi:histone-lysine N-methyltransferase SETMAR-like [Dermacentor silvarum]|uniref:histone-lysine N-methyltransferase SETMAR-like n=1 Tax=Dermacentor silvarum TaxID=543639 RepID=UPI0021017575|nr:histone-lysine N-methyltransferase SETMAR-like [Dermacentor silvarum]
MGGSAFATFRSRRAFVVARWIALFPDVCFAGWIDQTWAKVSIQERTSIWLYHCRCLAGACRMNHRRVQRIRPVIADNWKLHHDNAPAYSTFIITDYLVKAGVPTIPQPPYSPDLIPLDFFLFPHLKTPLKGKHFGTVDGIKAACTAALKAIPEEDYRNAFESWKSRWSPCIDAKGEYFAEF